MRNATGQSITIEQATNLLEKSTPTKVVEAGEMKATWLSDDDRHTILIQGVGDEFLLLS